MILLLIRRLKRLFCCLSAGKEGAGAVDEEDFIKAFEDVPTVQVSRIKLKHVTQNSKR